MSIVSSPLSDFPILTLCRKSESKQMSLEVTIAKHGSLDIESRWHSSTVLFVCLEVLYSYNKLNTSHMIQSSNNVCSSALQGRSLESILKMARLSVAERNQAEALHCDSAIVD